MVHVGHSTPFAFTSADKAGEDFLQAVAAEKLAEQAVQRHKLKCVAGAWQSSIFFPSFNSSPNTPDPTR